MSFRVAADEQIVIRLGHVEADSVKILGYLQVSCFRCLLEAIERLFDSAYHLGVCALLEAWWLYHVHLLI